MIFHNDPQMLEFFFYVNKQVSNSRMEWQDSHPKFFNLPKKNIVDGRLQSKKFHHFLENFAFLKLRPTLMKSLWISWFFHMTNLHILQVFYHKRLFNSNWQNFFLHQKDKFKVFFFFFPKINSQVSRHFLWLNGKFRNDSIFSKTIKKFIIIPEIWK